LAARQTGTARLEVIVADGGLTLRVGN